MDFTGINRINQSSQQGKQMRLLRIIQKQPVQEEGPLEIDASHMIGVKYEKERIRSDADKVLCEVRGSYEFANGAVWLSDTYDWKLGVDSTGAICAVPLERK